jgi:hypothetical protein
MLAATWKEFMDLLGIRVEGLEKPAGVRPHEKPAATPKEKLLPYYINKVSGTGKESYVLNPFLDVMHIIFRNTLFPRMGDKDKVHSYLVDMLLNCEKGRISLPGPLDVSHIMWCELQSAVFHRKVPIYGPYLFYLIRE